MRLLRHMTNKGVPQVYVIAGPNGSGKTTSAYALLPDLLDCYEYVNADSVAAALSPFNPDNVAMQAGGLMLERIEELAKNNKSFSFETTLASRSFIPFLNKCSTNGYKVTVLYLWLSSPDVAISRVRSRVAQGGHDIPQDVIIRRYYRSLFNFVSEYTNLAHNWYLVDNSGKYSDLIACKLEKQPLNIIDENIWNQVNSMRHEYQTA